MKNISVGGPPGSCLGTTAIVDVLGMTYKVREQTATSFVIKINNKFSIEFSDSCLFIFARHLTFCLVIWKMGWLSLTGSQMKLDQWLCQLSLLSRQWRSKNIAQDITKYTCILSGIPHHSVSFTPLPFAQVCDLVLFIDYWLYLFILQLNCFIFYYIF